MWVFETSSGYSILKLHEAMEDILLEERKTNPYFGMQFTSLCHRIYAKNKKIIFNCFEKEEEYILKELNFKIDLKGRNAWQKKSKK